MLFKMNTLQKRLIFFLLLPVALMLLAIGYAGFIFARNALLEQWREAAVLKLERAAAELDSRLREHKHWLQMFQRAASVPGAPAIQLWLVEELRRREGVVRVVLRANPGATAPHPMAARQPPPPAMGTMMRFHRARIASISSPRYDAAIDAKAVSMVSELLDRKGDLIGTLEVTVKFDYLMEKIVTSGWWQTNEAYLVDDTGKILTCTLEEVEAEFCAGNDPLRQATMAAIKEKNSGTVITGGHPPDEVSGFYRLREAPWTLVVVAPGRDILAPILRFRFYYALFGICCIAAIVSLIRAVACPTVRAIREVSEAAGQIAAGDFTSPLAIKRTDEVGQLRQSFNTMVAQLRERFELKHALLLAMEVQQRLLPRHPPEIPGYQLAGTSIYCDDTGGDYFDYLDFPPLGDHRIAVAVGDVAGHGIAAALVMASVRAFLRSRTGQPGKPAEIITDVNRLLCLDSAETANFMTLFFLVLDWGRHQVSWIRAGHDPALVYHAATDTFGELGGDGLALGIDPSYHYQEYHSADLEPGDILLIGTDGIWEAEDPQGNGFGKRRLRQLLRRHHRESAPRLVEIVTRAVSAHQAGVRPRDDLTLVVVKRRPPGDDLSTPR